MKSTTELRVEYALFSWQYEFPDNIELALERDYITNQHLYDESALKRVSIVLLIYPDASPEYALKAVRNFQLDTQ